MWMGFLFISIFYALNPVSETLALFTIKIIHKRVVSKPIKADEK